MVAGGIFLRTGVGVETTRTCVEMKGRIALLFYCFLFSILFVLFYSLISQDSNLASVDFKINLEGDKVFQQNSVRKDLLPDRSPKVFLGRYAR